MSSQHLDIDGHHLFVRHWPSAKGNDVALLVHGVESHSGWFVPVGERLATLGLAALAFDRQGWGQSAGKRGHLANVTHALAELEATRAWLARKYARVHLVGLSWGGLLAAVARDVSKPPFASVTLLVPALYPKKRPHLGSLIAGLLGANRPIPLTIGVEDFARDPEIQRFIREDTLRMTAVSPAFIKTTFSLLRTTRRQFRRDSRTPTSMLLAQNDPLMDTPRTEAFAQDHVVTVHVLPDTVHSLVLEVPDLVAQHIVATAKRGGAQGLTSHAS